MATHRIVNIVNGRIVMSGTYSECLARMSKAATGDLDRFGIVSIETGRLVACAR